MRNNKAFSDGYNAIVAAFTTLRNTLMSKRRWSEPGGYMASATLANAWDMIFAFSRRNDSVMASSASVYRIGMVKNHASECVCRVAYRTILERWNMGCRRACANYAVMAIPAVIGNASMVINTRGECAYCMTSAAIVCCSHMVKRKTTRSCIVMT